MQPYDVIIIGAGPGGLRCAETLGNSSLRVVLLEKNNEIGPKVCAGGLTGKSFDHLNLPPQLVEFSLRNVKLHVNNISSSIKSDSDFAFTIDRKELGQWQLQKLKQYPNIEVRTNSKVSQITREFVVVGDEKIRYKYLVGADGTNSIVKTFLGIKTRSICIGIQYIIHTDKYKDFEIFFKPKYFSAWYAWIFPHRGYAAVGCAVENGAMPAKELKENFHRWLKERDIDITEATYEAFPMNTDYHGINFGNIFLVGDAAGLVSHFTGEGIYQALISGEEVAKTILDSSYTQPKMPAILHKQARHKKLIDMVVKSGKFKSLIFTAGLFLFKIPKYERKAIRFFG